ncbi:hypothetical protein EHQ59_07245 [Leptospira kemamanensis]|uniref:Uncharacterized protein n=1 Tax=Leptospira kemamanensis TaxID=2484942 RepID=A0A4R9JRY5_9LEPT|nr:hypothetical protein EHQ59_07245 [Leptospira kemamanensis]
MSSHAFNFTRLECTFHETPNLSIYDRKNMRSFERFLVPPWKSRGIGKNDWTARCLCDIRLFLYTFLSKTLLAFLIRQEG